jgi:1-acyl-sn-glycerol-3-phosphate acyltransferase
MDGTPHGPAEGPAPPAARVAVHRGAERSGAERSGAARSGAASALQITYEYVALYSSLALLGLICLTWSLFALPLWYLLPERLGTAIGRRGIMAGFRLYAWSLSFTRTYDLDLRAIDALKGGPPLILAPNHPSLIDALLILTRHPNLVCVMKSALMSNPFLGAGSRLARYIRNDSSRHMIKESVAHLRRGGLLLLFPEGTRTRRAPINPLVGSVSVIAKHAKVPVQTLVIETDSPFLSKGWPLFKRPTLPITYRVTLGRRFDPPCDVVAFTAELDAYYRRALEGALQTRWLERL